jgi:hypothetical protein
LSSPHLEASPTTFALVLHLHQHQSSRNLHLKYLAKNQPTQRCQSLITQGSDHPPVLEPHMVLRLEEEESICVHAMWDPLGSEGAFSKTTAAQLKRLSSISQQLAKATFLKATAHNSFSQSHNQTKHTPSFYTFLFTYCSSSHISHIFSGNTQLNHSPQVRYCFLTLSPETSRFHHAPNASAVSSRFANHALTVSRRQPYITTTRPRRHLNFNPLPRLPRVRPLRLPWPCRRGTSPTTSRR